MGDLKLLFKGAEAEKAAETFAAAVNQKLGHTPSIEAMTPQSEIEHRLDPGLLIAGAAVILALPGAVLAVKDLFKPKENAAAIIKISKETLEKYPDLQISIIGSGCSLPEVAPTELLDQGIDQGKAG